MPADRISQCLRLLLIVGCQAENCDLQRCPTVIRIGSAIICVCRNTFTVRAGILMGILECQLREKLLILQHWIWSKLWPPIAIPGSQHRIQFMRKQEFDSSNSLVNSMSTSLLILGEGEQNSVFFTQSCVWFPSLLTCTLWVPAPLGLHCKINPAVDLCLIPLSLTVWVDMGSLKREYIDLVPHMLPTTQWKGTYL